MSAERQARYDSIHMDDVDFETRYNELLNKPTSSMEKEAREYAAKMTYTNDPNVYGGVLAAVARGAASAQSGSLLVNLVLPFVRTPANLLSFSMEMIGGNAFLSLPKLWADLTSANVGIRQEAMSKLAVASGLWLYVAKKYNDGEITGTGPANWEERKAWEAAGWQANSIKIQGHWVELTRAAPAGQSLATIATVYDYATLNPASETDFLPWVGAGLLYTADMIKDESYLSTVTTMLTAIESKEASAGQSLLASTINSVLVPNILRDIRRPVDQFERSGTSINLLDQMVKQIKNAVPGWSESLPPRRDWRGEPVQYFGNAYVRGLVPFKIKGSGSDDKASLEIAYHRIPVSTPEKTLNIPGAQGLTIGLMEMDNGRGFVYDQYVKFIGESRYEMVDKVVNHYKWSEAVGPDKPLGRGPGSFAEMGLRRALAAGTQLGKARFYEWMHKQGDQFRTADGKLHLIKHPVTKDTYRQAAMFYRRQPTPDWTKPEQLNIPQPKEGPEFFNP
jgi:hypothetical protein